MEEKQILIVHDHEHYLEMFSRRLQDAGYQVRCVLTGEEGVAWADRGPFDLVLLDYYLQKGGEKLGTDYLPALKKALPGVPVVVITALSPGDVDNVDVPGVAGWIHIQATKEWWAGFAALLEQYFRGAGEQ